MKWNPYEKENDIRVQLETKLQLSERDNQFLKDKAQFLSDMLDQVRGELSSVREILHDVRGDRDCLKHTNNKLRNRLPSNRAAGKALTVVGKKGTRHKKGTTKP